MPGYRAFNQLADLMLEKQSTANALAPQGFGTLGWLGGEAGNALAEIAGARAGHEPKVLGRTESRDAFGVTYPMTVYRIGDRPAGVECVYCFARRTASGYEPFYLGRAEVLSQRLSGHDKFQRARDAGADVLLVWYCTSQNGSRFKDVERRLIQYYQPPLNDQLK